MACSTRIAAFAVAIIVIVSLVSAAPVTAGNKISKVQNEMMIKQELETGFLMSEMRLEQKEPLSAEEKLAKLTAFIEKCRTMLKSLTERSSKLKEKKKALMNAPGVDKNEMKIINEAMKNYDILTRKIKKSKAKAVGRKAALEKKLGLKDPAEADEKEIEEEKAEEKKGSSESVKERISKLKEKKGALMKAPGVDKNEMQTTDEALKSYRAMMKKNKKLGVKRKTALEKKVTKTPSEGEAAVERVSSDAEDVPETAVEGTTDPVQDDEMTLEYTSEDGDGSAKEGEMTELPQERPLSTQEKLAKLTESIANHLKILKTMTRRYADEKEMKAEMMEAPGIDKNVFEAVVKELKDLAERIEKAKADMRGMLRTRKELVEASLME